MLLCGGGGCGNSGAGVSQEKKAQLLSILKITLAMKEAVHGVRKV